MNYSLRGESTSKERDLFKVSTAVFRYNMCTRLLIFAIGVFTQVAGSSIVSFLSVDLHLYAAILSPKDARILCEFRQFCYPLPIPIVRFNQRTPTFNRIVGKRASVDSARNDLIYHGILSTSSSSKDSFAITVE